MRIARIKEAGEGFYHVMSRVVDRRIVLDEKEKERFRQIMRRAAAFSGIDVLTYIDLNAVRAGIVTDPGGYRFCGYGEARCGSRQALASVMCSLGSEARWNAAHDLPINRVRAVDL